LFFGGKRGLNEEGKSKRKVKKKKSMEEEKQKAIKINMKWMMIKKKNTNKILHFMSLSPCFFTFPRLP